MSKHCIELLQYVSKPKLILKHEYSKYCLRKIHAYVQNLHYSKTHLKTTRRRILEKARSIIIDTNGLIIIITVQVSMYSCVQNQSYLM